MTHARTHTHGANYNLPPASWAGDKKIYGTNQRLKQGYQLTHCLKCTSPVTLSLRSFFDGLGFISQTANLNSGCLACSEKLQKTWRYVYIHLHRLYILHTLCIISTLITMWSYIPRMNL